MTDPAAFPADRLATLVSAANQRLAARMAQDAFGQIFRLTLAGDAAAVTAAVAEMQAPCRNWARAGGNDEARALRLALLVCGLDQWGLAYSQAFGLHAIPGLSLLLGNLRETLDAAEDARFTRQFAAINAVETDAVDFKMELRRNIHLALWHAMAASEDGNETRRLAAALGSLMLSLVQGMPTLGWRLVADALAHCQIRLLAEAGEGSERAATATTELLVALRANLAPEVHQLIVGHANQATLAWRHARQSLH